jgi:hypothetical protein
MKQLWGTVLFCREMTPEVGHETALGMLIMHDMATEDDFGLVNSMTYLHQMSPALAADGPF